MEGGNEKGKNVILKLGSRTIECGFEDSSRPLTTFNVHHFSELQNFKITDILPNHSINSNTIKTKNDKLKSIIIDDHMNFRHLFHPDLLIFEDADIFLSNLRIHLKKLLLKIFFRCGISTINTKLLLLQNMNFPRVYTEVISNILIKDLFMRAVVILPTPLMISIGSGSSMGIIIDIGWSKTSITPIFDNRILTNYARFTTNSGSKLHYRLLEKISDVGLNISSISFRDLENSIVNLEHLNSNSNDDSLTNCGPYLIKNQIFKEVINEIFFGGESDCEDNELPICQLIADLINKDLPIDLRSQLSSKLIFNGGITEIVGFKSLMISKIEGLVTQKISGIETLGDWRGACIYSTIMKHQKKSSNLWEIRKE